MRTEDHEGIVFDKLQLADVTLLEVESCDGCTSCRTNPVHGIKDNPVDVDCYCQHTRATRLEGTVIHKCLDLIDLEAM